MFYVAALLAALAGLAGLYELGSIGAELCRYGDTFCDRPMYLLVTAGLAAAWGAFVSIR